MFYSGDPISISEDRLTATENTDRQASTRAKLVAVGHGLKRLLAELLRRDDHELEHIARDPRMLDDIGLTRADVEPMLRRRPVAPAERYPGLF